LDVLYGQRGLFLQPSFVDPLQTQYFQHPAEDAYGASGQYGWLGSMGVLGGQSDSFASQKEATFAPYRGDQNFQPSPDRNLSIVSPRKGGITASTYYDSPPSMGVMTHFPASPLGIHYCRGLQWEEQIIQEGEVNTDFLKAQAEFTLDGKAKEVETPLMTPKGILFWKS